MLRLDLIDFSGRLFTIDFVLRQDDVRFGREARNKLREKRDLPPTWWPLKHAKTLRAAFYAVTGLTADYMALAEYYATLKRCERLVHDDETEEDCLICTKPLRKPGGDPLAEEAVMLTCGHVFGEHCLAEWISVFNGLSHACPMCRKAIWLVPTNSLKQMSRKYKLPIMAGDSGVDHGNDAHGRFIQTYFGAAKILEALSTRLSTYRALAARKDPSTRKAMIDCTTQALVLCCQKPSRRNDEPLILRHSDGTIMTVLDASMRILWKDDAVPSLQDLTMSAVDQAFLRAKLRELASCDEYISFLRLNLKFFDDRVLEASLSFSHMFLLMPADMRADLATASPDSINGGLDFVRERAHQLASKFENDAERALKAHALAAEQSALYLPNMASALVYAINRLSDLSPTDRRLIARVQLSMNTLALENTSCRERSQDLATVVLCLDGILEKLAPNVTRDEYEDALARLRQEGTRVMGLEADGTPRHIGWTRQLREPVRTIVGRQSTPYVGASRLSGLEST